MDKLLSGDDLRSVRKKLKLSVRKMGEVMAIHYSSVSRWENGKFVSDKQKHEAQRMLFMYVQQQSQICNRLAVLLRQQNVDATR